MSTTRLTYPRGDTAVYDFTITQGGAAYNLTGATITFMVKASIGDADGSAKITKTVGSGITVTSAVGGICRLTLSPADTSSLEADWPYHWDLQIKDGSGNINTPDGLSGQLVVTADINNAIS